ncbi:hypothetical protein [Paracidovorax anthurii]|uniref:Uncharacterized protein n=1 Tax=Paracidovorax anthurii TaxID=78229 RepID=A0A328Z4U9_9BURK|nr:hypothetical protein [Paracidovorax anthurii]RAR77807.1 hypothetical protein AX018_103410 [Paracidovorax anthurii]
MTINSKPNQPPVSRSQPRAPVQGDGQSSSTSGTHSRTSSGTGSRRHEINPDGPQPRQSSLRHDGGETSSRRRVSLQMGSSPTHDEAPLRKGSKITSEDYRHREGFFDNIVGADVSSARKSNMSEEFFELPQDRLHELRQGVGRESNGSEDLFEISLDRPQGSQRGNGENTVPPLEISQAGHQGGEENTVPPRQSWKAMMKAAFSDAGTAGGIALGAAKQAVGSAVAATGYGAAYGVTSYSRNFLQAGGGALSAAKDLLLTPNKRVMGAIVGHLTHQGVAVGVTTLAREVAAEGLRASLRHLPAGALLGIEVGMGVTNFSLQMLRQARERRNPDEAARGFHALSPDEWARKTPDEKDALRAEQQKHSNRVTLLQVASLMTNVSLAIYGTVKGDNSLAAASIASEAKVLAYSVMRDAIQSKWGMVKLTPEDHSHGVSGSHLNSAGLFYGGANVVAGYAWGGLPGLVLPKNISTDNVRDVLRGVEVPGLSKGEAWEAVTKMAMVKFGINTALETADWFSVTEQEALQSHSLQTLSPHIKGNDFGRLKDHVAARVAILDSTNSVGDLVSFLTKDLPPAVSALLTNGAVGAWAAANYKTIGSTWQADGAVRAAENQPRPPVRGPENV